MPYSGASDTNLPPSVQKLPKALRALWVKVFNENYDPDDEGKAFRIAWGAVRKVQSAKKARLVAELDLADWRAWLQKDVLMPQTKSYDVQRVARSVEEQLIAQFPNRLIPVQVLDDCVIAFEMTPLGGPEAEGEMPAMPVPTLPDAYLRIPYDCTFEVVSEGNEVLSGVTFAAEDAWTKVVPIFAQLTVKEAANGRKRWTLLSSGAFQDRDGEILSQDFLASALDYADKNAFRGTLNLWHIKNSDVGDCDLQMLVGEPPFLLESGLFHDTPAGQHAAAYFAAHAPETGGSLEFSYRHLTPEGIYEAPGVIVRRSLLPREHAAFPWSALQIKESHMPKARPEQIAYLAQVLEITEADATKMVEKLEAGSQTLVDLGVNWKEVTPQADAAPIAEEVVVDATAPSAPEAVSEPDLAAVTPDEPVNTLVAEPLDVVLTPETVTALAQQVLASVEATFGNLRAQLDTLAQSFNDLLTVQTAQVAVQKELQETVLVLKQADDAKLAQLVKDLPRGVVARAGVVERPSQRPPEAVAAKEESMLARGKATLFG